MFEKEFKEVEAVINRYFEGIYYGDIGKLSSAFHPECLLIGDINGQPYLKNLSEYLDSVGARKSPQELGESFRMKMLSMEILNVIAYLKLHVPIFGYNYYDYMSLSKISGHWRIVNKIFTNVSWDK